MISAACSLPAVARTAAFKPTVLLSLQRGGGGRGDPQVGTLPPCGACRVQAWVGVVRLWAWGCVWGWEKPTVRPSSGGWHCVGWGCAGGAAWYGGIVQQHEQEAHPTK